MPSPKRALASTAVVLAVVVSGCDAIKRGPLAQPTPTPETQRGRVTGVSSAADASAGRVWGVSNTRVVITTDKGEELRALCYEDQLERIRGKQMLEVEKQKATGQWIVTKMLDDQGAAQVRRPVKTAYQCDLPGLSHEMNVSLATLFANDGKTLMSVEIRRLSINGNSIALLGSAGSGFIAKEDMDNTKPIPAKEFWLHTTEYGAMKVIIETRSPGEYSLRLCMTPEQRSQVGGAAPGQ
jgi:hypothetical protein